MAVKLAKGVRTVGASLYEGLLAITIGPDTWAIEVPTKQNYLFQLNEYDNPYVFCYLYNKDTELVIRRDGTGTLAKKGSLALIKNFSVKIPTELKDVEVYPGGLASFANTEIADFVNICIIKSKGTAIMSFDTHGDSVIINVKDCFSYLTDVSLRAGIAYPPMFYENGKFERHAEANNRESKLLYEFSGAVLNHPTIMVLD